MLRSTLLATFALFALAACAGDPPTAPQGAQPEAAAARVATLGGEQLSSDVLAALAQVRRATARFHDIDKALEAGYTVWSPDPFAAGATCASNPAGQMGYHLVNVALRGSPANPAAGDATIDMLQPEMLLYEKRADGKMHLVGVEYLVFKAAWERVHGVGAAPPTVMGQPLPLSTHTFTPTGPAIPHYEVHVWIWSSNPLGMFAPWNPTVSC